MANYANPRKTFQFLVEIDGVEQFAVQKVKFPEITIGVTEHGEGNTTIKTPGMVTTGTCVIEKLKPSDAKDTWASVWMGLTQNMVTGGGALPAFVKRNIVLKEMDTTGTIVLDRHILEGCFPTKYSRPDFDRLQKEENSKEIIELSVDKCYLR
jgi:phage tail-like protein